MPDEPLIFVEVALVDGMAGNIQYLLDTEAPLLDPKDADTAIFYSISNAQNGLAGISFGGFLIKRVVDNLAAEFKGLKTFATLSPAPGFRAWLDGRLSAGEEELLTAAELKAITAVRNRDGGLKAVLADPQWHRDAALCEAPARTADASLRPVSDPREARKRGRRRSRRPFSPEQRGAHRTAALEG